jgi:hypothetical protein
MSPDPARLIVIDPGREKHGVAVVDARGTCLARTILPGVELIPQVLRWQEGLGPARLLLGDGTGHREVLHLLREAGLSAEVVPEQDTTRRARIRYFTEHPPSGWRRLLPVGLLTPPNPIDDYAALIIAEDFLAGATPQKNLGENREET